MSKPEADPRRRREPSAVGRRHRGLWLAGPVRAALALLLMLSVSPAGTQAQEEEEDLSAAREALEERYEVLPIRGGVVLRPRHPAELESIELRAGEIAIDGDSVSAEELSRRVGDEEATVLQALSTLEEEELRTLFASPPQLPTATPPEERDRATALEEAIEARMERVARRMEERARRAEERSREAEIRAERRRRPGGDTRVTMGGAVHVLEGETTGDVVSLGGAVTVDGEVLGDAVAIGGPVRVSGRVLGDVVAVGGGVRLESTAEVLGQVVTVGGRLDREPGSTVLGEITEVSILGGFLSPLLSRSMDWEWGWDRRSYFRGSVTKLLGNLTRLLALALIGALVLVLAPGPASRVAMRIERQPLVAGAVGLTALLFYGPAVVLVSFVLLISFLGIPLILLVLLSIPVFLAVAFFGYVAAAYALGRWSERRFGWRLGGPVIAFLVGLLMLHGWGVLADIVNVADGPRNVLVFLVMIFALFGFLLKLAAWSMGLGGVILDWGEKRKGGAAAVAPSPPTPPAPAALSPVLESTPPAGEATLASSHDPSAPQEGAGSEAETPLRDEARREEEPTLLDQDGPAPDEARGAGDEGPASAPRWEEPWPEEEERWPRAQPGDEPPKDASDEPPKRGKGRSRR